MSVLDAIKGYVILFYVKKLQTIFHVCMFGMPHSFCEVFKMLCISDINVKFLLQQFIHYKCNTQVDKSIKLNNKTTMVIKLQYTL